MTIEPSLGFSEDDPDRGAGPPAQNTAVYGEVAGQLTVGRYVLRLGEPWGAAVREATPAERHVTRRPTPILVRPRPIRSLIGRQDAQEAALAALGRGLHVEVSGEPGVGKTALLRCLAHHPVAGSFPDGVLYLQVRHQTPADLMQIVLEAFYETARISKPTEAEIRRDLQDTQALILLDDTFLGEDEIERVLDIAPRSAFVVATRKRILSGEVRNVRMDGLPADDAVLLLEREIERALEADERSASASLCAAIAGHPLRILRAAAVIRDAQLPPGDWVRELGPERLLASVMASVDDRQRRVLMALSAMRGVPAPVQHVANIAEVTDVEPMLAHLVRRGIVARSQSRYQLTEGVADWLRRTGDPKPFVNRAITYFTAWAERHRRRPNVLLEEAEPILAAQQQALDERRWEDALRLGRLIEGALVLGARWGAWSASLERCVTGAKAIGNRSAEAWALHELGTGALCLGETSTARAVLGQAVQLRHTLGDDVGAAGTQSNLALVLVPVAEVSRAAATDLLDDFPPLPLHDGIPPDLAHASAHAPRMVVFLALLFAILGGLVYWSPAARESLRGVSASSFGLNRPRPAPQPAVATPVRESAEPAPTAGTPGDVAAASDTREKSAETPTPNVLILTARPGSIVTSGSTEVCYAVTDAVQARIDPGVGEVPPSSTLTCRHVSPRQTTTYTLSASGAGGSEVTKQVVIVVR